MACDSPIWIKSKGQDLPVPCGKCPACKTRRVNEWVFRLMWEEERNSFSSHFVTLTYDTAHVPLSPYGFMTLRKSDFQNFMKRLRKIDTDFRGREAVKLLPLKYYACGEYGSTYSRPHYHAIILNCQNPDWYAQAWSLDGVQFGNVDVGTCTTDSVAYCLKYIDKNNHTKRAVRHARDDREFEFPLMSKGLGQSYVQSDSIKAYHQADLSRNYLTKRGGYRVAMPRYYREKLFSEKDLEIQRDIINIAVSNADAEARRLHELSGSAHTYADELEMRRKAREIKFEGRQKNRSQF